MSISSRRRLGLLLVCSAIVAWIIALIFFSHSRVIGSGSSGNASWIATETKIDLGWYFSVPVILCGAIGVFCLAWPTPKPPKLH
jgi:hypothetical protein